MDKKRHGKCNLLKKMRQKGRIINILNIKIMRFLAEPLICGIVFYFIYMTFELFVRKQERISLIERMGQNLIPTDPGLLKNQFSSLLPTFKKSFTSLRIGCLFTGLGLGLMVGLFISLFIKAEFKFGDSYWEREKIFNVAYGASVLFFGGLGLLISYLIESKSTPKAGVSKMD